MSAWKLVVHFLLPPPLVLTLLVLLPVPFVVRKGFLLFTRRVLFLSMVGGVRLVHLALLITGGTFVASSIHTYKLKTADLPESLTANQRTSALSRRWREERNFWIATLTFLLWGLLYRFYNLMSDHVAVMERCHVLEKELLMLRRRSAPSAPPEAVMPMARDPPSAPLEVEMSAQSKKHK